MAKVFLALLACAGLPALLHLLEYTLPSRVALAISALGSCAALYGAWDGGTRRVCGVSSQSLARGVLVLAVVACVVLAAIAQHAVFSAWSVAAKTTR